MAKNKRYSTVSDLMADVLPDDATFVDELQEQIDRRRLVRGLASLRNAKKVSQEEIAKVADCGQSRISKIENGYDSDVKIGDLEAYANALDCDIQVVLRSRDMTLVDEVKFLAFRMKKCFDRMSELAHKDDDVATGVAAFHIEALFNLVDVVTKSAKRLPKSRRPHLQLTAPDVELSDCDKKNSGQHLVSS